MKYFGFFFGSWILHGNDNRLEWNWIQSYMNRAPPTYEMRKKGRRREAETTVAIVQIQQSVGRANNSAFESSEVISTAELLPKKVFQFTRKFE